MIVCISSKISSFFNVDVERTQKTKTFFNDKITEVPGYARSLSKLEESINDCIALKNRELNSVNSFLKR